MDESKESIAKGLFDILQQLEGQSSSRPIPSLMDVGSSSAFHFTRERYQNRHDRQGNGRFKRDHPSMSEHQTSYEYRPLHDRRNSNTDQSRGHSSYRYERSEENRLNRRTSRDRDDSACKSDRSSGTSYCGGTNGEYGNRNRRNDAISSKKKNQFPGADQESLRTGWRGHSNHPDDKYAQGPETEFTNMNRSYEFTRNRDGGDCESAVSNVSPKWRTKTFDGDHRVRNDRGHLNWTELKNANQRYPNHDDGHDRGFVASDVPRDTRKPQKQMVKFEIAENKKCWSSKVHDEASIGPKIKTVHVGYKYLVELTEKPVHEILAEMQLPESKFGFLLTQKVQTDWMFLILKIISKVCLSDFIGTKHEVLLQVCRSPLLDNVSFYLGEVGLESSKPTIANLKMFVDDLTEFYSAVVNTLPTVALEKDFAKLIKKAKLAIGAINSELNGKIEEAVSNKLTTLLDRLADHKNMVDGKIFSKTELSHRDRLAEMAPPDDFRELSLYPTYEDLTRNTFGFVRPNKIKGAYSDVEHYLDVQFRLLREDFIDPLRRGLKQYLEAKSTTEKGNRLKSKYESVRLYRKTRFEHVETTQTNQVGYVLNFDVDEKLKRINWEYCKRFMFGSLLLFSSNYFDTFFYGTVLDRSIKRLTSGRILVALAESVVVDETFFSVQFLLAESEVFFEPYFLVMKSLTTLEERNFPMPNYIVRGQCHTEHPKYLPNFQVFNILHHSVDPLNIDRWPSANDLALDDYQYRAFKKALTSEFCVIQGPPGTGKTFLGLKIVQVLLENIALNPHAVRTPILVVCFTNHALDQFLEGILPMTEKIVRVGGQSKSEVLKPFNLRGQNQIAARREARMVNHVKSAIKDEMKAVLEQIHRATETKKNVETPIGVMNYSSLVHVMNSYQKIHIRNDKDLLSWLFQSDSNDDSHSESEEEEVVFNALNFRGASSSNVIANEPPVEIDANEEEDDENIGIVDEDEIFLRSMQNPNVCYSLTVATLGDRCERLISEYTQLKEFSDYNILPYEAMYSRKHELQRGIKRATADYHILKDQLANPEVSAEKYKLFSAMNIRTLKLEQRWIMYWYWIKLLRDHVIRKLNLAEEKYRSKTVQYDEYKQIEDLYVVKKADVVGMTTTGAARLRILLSSLQPAIVLVEEAAEVLEAHIVASLTHACEHVILIGDHKQLKPSAAVYQLTKHYNIDVSLFERMINNGMDCPSLNIQHRMRPEISSLITPLIYPDLKNHSSVLEYESIRGVAKNIFFLEHNVFEESVDDDMSSRKNIFEAEYVLELCRYLVLQGYNPSTITILTTYSGQMFLFREKKRNKYPLLKDVKCIVVDKYQGEENDIILLSLVRSNAKANIGFLKTENRVCVALSRAKKALYIVGNMSNLVQSSPMWKEIKKILENGDNIGKEMKLYCDKHEIYTGVSTIKDFDQVREGGCNQYCGELMKCGHNCKSLCHTMDREHLEVRCREPCSRFCPRLHPCRKFCDQTCGSCDVIVTQTLACAHSHKLPCHIDETTFLCDVIVDDISPVCQHPIKRKCWEDAAKVQCAVPCEDRLDCGHACTLKCHQLKDPDHLEFKCHKPCEKLNELCSKEHRCQKLCFEACGKCTIQMKFQLPCGHEGSHPCSVDLTQVKCFKKCRKTCGSCNQKCKKCCWEDCAPCKNEVIKKIPECGHDVKLQCNLVPQRADCVSMCNRNAPCGHKCKAKCSKQCGVVKCDELVKFPLVNSACGHPYVLVPCHKRTEVSTKDPESFLQYCDEPCNTVLKCGDPCAGTCGQCWQGRLHKSCQKKCGNTLICGHSCPFPCRQVCPPCNEVCNYRCKHSKCPKRCGVPCVHCQERCEWGCRHSRCSRRCGDMCNREPCYEPCEKILICNHPCIGFCGEPCPPLCRMCNPEITEIMFGWEDEPDARFVYLEDCKHTIESRALDQHLKSRPEGGEIVMKVCPLCKTPITRTLRYMNYVKETYSHIINVKKKIFGHDKLMYGKRKELTTKLNLLTTKAADNLRLTGLRKILDTSWELMEIVKIKKNGRNTVSNTQISAISYVHDVFVDIVSRLDELLETKVQAKPNAFRVPSNVTVKQLASSTTVLKIMKCIRHVVDRISSIKMNANQQQMVDISCEVGRFHKMVDFHGALNDPLYAGNRTNLYVISTRKEIESLLFGCCRYTPDVNDKVVGLFDDFGKALKARHPLTSDEKRMIHMAMSSSFYNGGTGHWFTCPNGHYYCITECGGAMQESNCPECGVRIGGTNHRYLDTVRLAGDMDGATRAAWSTGANMANYQFD